MANCEHLPTTHGFDEFYGILHHLNAGGCAANDIVGEILSVLDETGVADNRIVMFSTDNRTASNSWPDGGNTPFRGENRTRLSTDPKGSEYQAFSAAAATRR